MFVFTFRLKRLFFSSGHYKLDNFFMAWFYNLVTNNLDNLDNFFMAWFYNLVTSIDRFHFWHIISGLRVSDQIKRFFAALRFALQAMFD